MNKKFGFTLAEVLITLAIIGVVAALTLPTLISNYNEKVIITKLKKFHATLAQATQMNKVEHPTDAYVGQYLWDNFYIERKCHPNFLDCAPETYKKPSGENAPFGAEDPWGTSYTYVILKDSSIIRYNTGTTCEMEFGTSEALKHVCSEIIVDLNGNKGPNTLGKDTFTFYATSQGIIPAGTKDCTYQYGKFSTCKTDGHGCTAYALEYGTLDYSKYEY